MCADIVREVLSGQVSLRLEAAQVNPSDRSFNLSVPSFSNSLQKTRPDTLAFLSDFVIDAVVDQFAREIVLECTRERSRQALYLLKEEREVSRFWDDIVAEEMSSVAGAALEECRAEQAALAKKAQPQVLNFDLRSVALSRGFAPASGGCQLGCTAIVLTTPAARNTRFPLTCCFFFFCRARPFASWAPLALLAAAARHTA